MRKIAAILAFSVALVFGIVSGNGFKENGIAVAKLLDQAQEHMTLELRIANLDLAAKNAELDVEIAQKEHRSVRKQTDAALRAAMALGSAQGLLGEHSFDDDMRKVAALKAQRVTLGAEGVVALAFLIAGWVLYAFQSKNRSTFD